MPPLPTTRHENENRQVVDTAPIKTDESTRDKANDSTVLLCRPVRVSFLSSDHLQNIGSPGAKAIRMPTARVR